MKHESKNREETTMNQATREREARKATTTTMVRDGVVYQHNPATVGHPKHEGACWVEMPAAHRLGCRCWSEYMSCASLEG